MYIIEFENNNKCNIIYLRTKVIKLFKYLKKFNTIINDN